MPKQECVEKEEKYYGIGIRYLSGDIGEDIRPETVKLPKSNLHKYFNTIKYLNTHTDILYYISGDEENATVILNAMD